MEIETIKNELIAKIKEYAKLILSEYQNYNTSLRLTDLENIDFTKIVHIKDTNTISLFVKNQQFYFPKLAFNIMDSLSQSAYYGKIPNHKSYTDETLIDNDNTFYDYINHAILAGLNAKDYFNENLLHEVFHFCGSGGGTALKEGINELLTRRLAKKYNLVTSGCGYPKELKVVLELEKLFKTDTIIRLAFAKSYQETITILENINADFKELYFNIEKLMENEFQTKYYQYSFKGLNGHLLKAKKYEEIDYTAVYDLIYEYDLKKIK